PLRLSVGPNGCRDLLRAWPPAHRRSRGALDTRPGRDALAHGWAAPLARPGRRRGRRGPGRARRAPRGAPGRRARDRPREPGPGGLRIALGVRAPHLARGGAPPGGRRRVAALTDALRPRT